jgi:hypothetical protein
VVVASIPLHAPSKQREANRTKISASNNSRSTMHQEVLHQEEEIRAVATRSHNRRTLVLYFNSSNRPLHSNSSPEVNRFKGVNNKETDQTRLAIHLRSHQAACLENQAQWNWTASWQTRAETNLAGNNPSFNNVVVRVTTYLDHRGHYNSNNRDLHSTAQETRLRPVEARIWQLVDQLQDAIPLHLRDNIHKLEVSCSSKPE